MSDNNVTEEKDIVKETVEKKKPEKKEFERVDRGSDDKSFSRYKQKVFFKRKICRFCNKKDLIINYKEIDMLKRFTSERGKIIPRRITGTCAKHQRQLARSIKRARVLALLPFVAKYSSK